MGLTYRARAEDLSSRAVDGTVVLLDERDWNYLHLNSTGALLWPLIEGGATAADLSAALAKTFGISEADAQRDVEAFLADLVAKDLVTADE